MTDRQQTSENINMTRQELAELISECEHVIMFDHPNKKEMLRQLQTDELEKRLRVIGPAFDTTGRVALMLKFKEMKKVLYSYDARTDGSVT